jgi:HAD superfamily hydrolase (TIGR01509 family)
MLPEAVSGIVFDCDGLLLDTETCWARAEATLLAQHGHPFGERERSLLLGRTVDDICEVIAALIGRPGQGAGLRDDLMVLVEAELGTHVTPMAGARELLAALSQRFPLAIASNSHRPVLDMILQSGGIADHFEVTVAADEVANPKPHPQLYLTAFARLGAAPAEGVAFEDSATGATAARAAGAFVIAVPSATEDTAGRLDGDFHTDSLSDPRLHRWARTVASLPG